MRGATLGAGNNRGSVDISIHAPLAGCDDFANIERKIDNVFQSTHPLRGATGVYYALGSATVFQSTHPLRGATMHLAIWSVFISISIHAPLAGCDQKAEWAAKKIRISIHAPLAGCDRALLHGVAYGY